MITTMATMPARLRRRFFRRTMPNLVVGSTEAAEEAVVPGAVGVELVLGIALPAPPYAAVVHRRVPAVTLVPVAVTVITRDLRRLWIMPGRRVVVVLAISPAVLISRSRRHTPLDCHTPPG